jgi:hypothetical protein
MVASWRRVAAGVGFALCGLLLTGCRAEGTFDILSEERVALDLVVSGPDVDCPNAVDALKLTIVTIKDASGGPACHVTGETQATYFSPFGINVSTAGEYLVLQANLAGGSTDWPTSDVQLRFPGQVVTATKGIVAGNSVRITDLGPLAQGSGMRVIALSRPGPPVWVTAAGLGLGSGVAGTLLILGLVRLAKRRRPAGGSDIIALEPAELPSLDGAAPVAAGSEGQGGVANDLPPPDGDPPARAEQQPDTTWFAAPTGSVPFDGASSSAGPGALPSLQPALSDRSPAAAPAGDEPPDHTVWAPPEDRA